MSTLSSILAHPGADRAALREKLEQGVFGLVAMALCVLAFAGSYMLSTYSFFRGGADVNRPTSLQGTPFSAPEAPKVILTARSEFILDGRWYPELEIDAALSARIAQNPDGRVILEADRVLPYADVKRMLQRLRKAGARKVYLLTWDNPAKYLAMAWVDGKGS